MRYRSIILVLLVAVASKAHGWSGEGHQIIAIIAETRLTQATWDALDELLGTDADGAAISISDAEVCNWADEIRRQRRNTATYHFVNIPYSELGYDPERDDPEGDNIVAAIQRFAAVLRDKQKPREERVEALKFLVHLVGDIHQPLHCIERNGDKGGNLRLVFFKERKTATSLHRVWDFDLVWSYIAKIRPLRLVDYAETLANQITVEEEAKWVAEGVADWANESHRLGVEQAYQGVPPDGDPPRITQDYIDNRREVVQLQLQRAGVRLAALLNQSLGAN